MAVVVALDAGTTGVRAFALGEDGLPRGWSYREFTQHFPRPGWVEHDAAEIWDVTRETLAELSASLEEPIAAIGVTNQRETVVVWSRRTGKPLHRAIVWQDRRTAERCDELAAEGHLDLVRGQTGLVLDPYFSATKLEWLIRTGTIDTSEDVAFGTVDSWVVWNLTGGASHVTDPSNASRTMLFDIGSLDWSPELLDLFSVPPSMMPEVRSSSGDFGTTVDGLGVSPGIRIGGIAGDQQAALFGQACFEPGMMKNTYGTGSFVLMNVGPTLPPPAEGLLTTVAWTLADGSRAYALEGAIFVTGAAVQWMRDGLGLIASAAEIGPLAESCGDTEGVYLVPAFTGLGSPYWDPYARGTLVGLTRGAGRAHLARAVVEAMTYQTRDVVEAMERASGRARVALRVDGGAAAMTLLLQLQADQLQVPVARPKVTETTALGAASLAGLAVGVFGSLDDITAHWQLDVRHEPHAAAAEVDQRYAGWKRAVERARG